MEMKVSGYFKAIIPETKMCRDFLKDIFQKEYHRQKKRPGQQRGVVCYKNNRRKETVFWCPECEAALCVEESFKAFQTKLNFLRYDLIRYSKSLDIPKYFVSSFVEIHHY